MNDQPEQQNAGPEVVDLAAAEAAAARAYVELRQGGLKIADPDLVALFDTTDPDFVAKARAAKPHLFYFDARSATPAALDAGWRDLKASERQRQRELAPTPRANFDARTASREDYAAECKRMGYRP